MNKKEVSEIKKLLNAEHAVINNICGCYVDGEKEIKFTSKEAFHSLSEEETFKYFEIFRKTLSGTIGKNLINMEFPLEAEKEGGTHEFLMKLRESKLKDDDLLNEFYQMIIDNYIYASNYYIILIHAVYDVPGKSTDGTEMFDSSTSVYEYIMCSICPVNLSKSGLSYDADTNSISERVRDWIVGVPANGFLFPAFNDRDTDIHGILYYTKNPEELQNGFIENVFGSVAPLTAGDQKETFNTLITNTLGDDCDFTTIKNIHETIQEMLFESKDEPEPLVLSREDVKHIFEESEVPTEKVEQIDRQLVDMVGEKPALIAENISNVRKFNVSMPDVEIKVSPDRTDLIETKIIDGKKCLVIEVTDRIEVNGVSVIASH